MTAAPTPCSHAHNSTWTLCTSCVARFTLRSPCSKRKKNLPALRRGSRVGHQISIVRPANPLLSVTMCNRNGILRSVGPTRGTTCAHLFMVHLTTLARLRGGHPTNRGSIANSGNKCDFPPSAIPTLETTLSDRKLHRGAASPVVCTGQPSEHLARDTEVSHEDPT